MSETAIPRRAIVLLVILTLVWGTNWPLFAFAVREISMWTFRAVAVTLAVISVEFWTAAQEAAEIKEVSQALNIPRGWAYYFISATSALAAVAALFVRNPSRAGHGAAHKEEVAS